MNLNTPAIHTGKLTAADLEREPSYPQRSPLPEPHHLLVDALIAVALVALLAGVVAGWV